MPESEPLHPRRADGSIVDATFELSRVPWFEIVYHHKAGGRDSPRSVNADYHEGLEILLTRLASVSAKILSISVDSSIAHELDPDDRELGLDFPIDLDPSTDCGELRLDITRAQKPIARRDDAKPGGGNDQKRILMTVAIYSTVVDFDDLRSRLTAGGNPSNLDSTATAQVASRRPPRRVAVPKVQDLVDAGLLPPGTRLLADLRGETVEVVLLDGVSARWEERGLTDTLGQLTNLVAGHSQSAMRLWSIEIDGRLKPLHEIRDEFAASPRWAPRRGRI